MLCCRRPSRIHPAGWSLDGGTEHEVPESGVGYGTPIGWGCPTSTNQTAELLHLHQVLKLGPIGDRANESMDDVVADVACVPR
jgi:hypothetical protein